FPFRSRLQRLPPPHAPTHQANRTNQGEPMMRKPFHRITHTMASRGAFLLGMMAVFMGSSALPAVSQTPITDLFIIQIEEEVGVKVFGVPKRISVHHGYNNQPSFTRDGRSILF